MRTLYLDCSMGAAGDMLSAALLELTDNPGQVLQELQAMGIPGVSLHAEASVKCGIQGTHMSVITAAGEEDEHMHEHEHPHSHEHEHEHSHEHVHEHSHEHAHEHSHEHSHRHSHGHEHGDVLHRIGHRIEHLQVSDKVKADILGVYTLLAQAESHVHGVPLSEIHFHEVGTMDALADIAMVCYLMERLNPARVLASAVHVGSGQVRCAHGILPVPAPATAELLKDIPIYGGEIQGELCTPTGAALLKYFVQEFGPMPALRLERTGYGMGKKDFPAANCVRAMLGTGREDSDSVYELSCNLDDMTGEEIGFAVTRLLEKGALDVYTAAIGMKKNRLGTLLRVLTSPDKKEELTRAVFALTTTLGVREALLKRTILTRRVEEQDTAFGSIRVKRAEGQGLSRIKAEYDDLAELARERDISLREARELLE